MDDEPTVLWEYWHTVVTKYGESREPGCNLELMPEAEESPSARTSGNNFHLHGPNSRINIDSTDSSINVADLGDAELFERMKDAALSITDGVTRDRILERIDELHAAVKTGDVSSSYPRFMASLADHMTIFGPFLMPLARIISGLSGTGM